MYIFFVILSFDRKVKVCFSVPSIVMEIMISLLEKKKKKKKFLCLADEEVWGIKIEAFYLFLLFVL